MDNESSDTKAYRNPENKSTSDEELSIEQEINELSTGEQPSNGEHLTNGEQAPTEKQLPNAPHQAIGEQLSNNGSLQQRPIIFPSSNFLQGRQSTTLPAKKIPRPTNAFMIFANENRRSVAKEHPLESNKEISIKLGLQWKNLSQSQKEKYHVRAKEIDAEHKKKYPDYVYNPKEARIRKAMRDRERSMANSSTSRSRRSTWSRQSPAPQMPPIGHGDPRMNMPNKDFHTVIRHELEHGILANTGNYVYPSQQYLLTPQSEYMSYINAIPSTSWPPHAYNMQNNNIQQQFWNQYQGDRMRMQANQGSPYPLNAHGQPSDYQVTRIPSRNMHMIATSKSIQQNVENGSVDVNRYLNIPHTVSSSTRSSSVDTDIGNSITVQQMTKNVMCTSVSNTEESIDSIIGPETVTRNVINDNSNAMSTTIDESSSQDNTSNMSVPLKMENSDDSTPSNFSGMQLFNEESVSGINSPDMRKNLTPNKEIMVEIKNFKQEPNSPVNLKPKYPEFFPAQHFPYQMLHANQMIYGPPFMPLQSPQTLLQQYFESVSKRNFDGSYLIGNQFIDYGVDAGYNNYLNYMRQHSKIPGSSTYVPNQLDIKGYFSDPCEMVPINLECRNQDNCVLDLSKQSKIGENTAKSETSSLKKSQETSKNNKK